MMGINMKKCKKLAIIVISLLLAISAVAGCDSGSDDNKAVVNKTGMPIVNEKITLKAMVLKHPEHGDFETMDFTKEMEEKTNIHIDWQIIPLGMEVSEKKALAFASGNMPDMFFIASIMTNLDIATYGPTGLIMPLNDLIKEYAPNVQKMLDAHPEYLKDITFDDGNIYSLPEVSEEMSDHTYFKHKMYINQKWLDTLGLEMPKTTDELYNVLRSFKSGDPNGNGLSDEIPFSSVNIDPAMMGPWGLSYWWDMDIMTINDNRQVSYVPMDPGFKKGLQYWNKLFSEGLLDEDIISLTNDQLKQKLSAADVKVGCFINYEASMVLPEERVNDYILMPPLEGPEGLKSMTNLTKRLQFMPNFFVMSGICKYPEAVMRWVDYLYSEEGTLLTKFGPDGKVYTTQPDGTIKYTAEENVPKDANGKPQFVPDMWNVQIAPGYILPQYWTNALTEKFKGSYYSQDVIDFNNLCFEYFDPVKPKYPMKDILFTRADILRISELGSQVHPVYNQYIPAFLMGDADIDSQWDTYVNGLKAMGVDEMIEIYQKYVDRIYPPE